MIFNIFLQKNSAKNIGFFTQNKAKLCKCLIITLVFEKSANFFRRKLSKIAENCGHNIDPRLGEFSHDGRSFTMSSFFNCRSSILGLKFLYLHFSTVKVMH
jgi:hypothetical protein